MRKLETNNAFGTIIVFVSLIFSNKINKAIVDGKLIKLMYF